MTEVFTPSAFPFLPRAPRGCTNVRADYPYHLEMVFLSRTRSRLGEMDFHFGHTWAGRGQWWTSNVHERPHLSGDSFPRQECHHADSTAWV